MAISSAAAVASQSYRDAEELHVRVYALRVYLEATEGHSSWEEYLETELSMLRALGANSAYRWFQTTGLNSSVKDDVLREVEEALLDRPWIAEPLTGDTAMMWDRMREVNEEDRRFLEDHPELKSKLDSSKDAVKDYVNTCVEYDSFREYAEADPENIEITRKAEESMRWILTAGLPDSLTESVLNAPANMMKEYPWIATGLQWAFQRLPEQEKEAFVAVAP